MAAMTDQVATGVALNFQLPADGSAPAWVPVIPKPDAQGRVVGRDGRHWVVNDPVALVAALNAAFAEIPFDINHANFLAAKDGRKSPSVGWPESFELRDGAIWSKPQWNEDGLNALKQKHYRFISPSLYFNPVTNEITGLHSISLTNHPNFSMPALNQRQANPDHEVPLMSIPKSITDRLQLNAEASEDAVTAAIDKLLNDRKVAINAAQTPDPDKFVPKSDHDRVVALNQQLQADAKTRQAAAIEAEVDAAIEAGKFAPASKEHYVALCHSEGGLERFRKLVEVTAPIAQDSGLDGKQVGTNAKQATALDAAVCAQLGLDPEDAKAA